MKALLCTRLGGPEHLELHDVPDPVTGPGEAIVEVEAAALNFFETLIVLGASGGVGLAAVELGKIMGARVIACASSDEKLSFARAHGADAAVNYAAEDLRSALKRLGGERGIDVVYDPVGGPHAEA